MSNRKAVAWVKSTGLNYVSECGQFVALYHNSYGGLACYRVFPVASKRRRLIDALSVGGLPQFVHC